MKINSGWAALLMAPMLAGWGAAALCAAEAPALSPRAAQAMMESLNLPAGTPEYRVGAGCEYTTIQAAIDAIPANGTGILRIRSGNYNENVTVVNKTVELIGGHLSCVAAAPAPGGLSAIDAVGTGAPALAFMVLGGTAASHGLHLTNLNLANGTGVVAPFVPFPGGGLSVWTGADRTANVSLDHSSVFDNQSAFRGGGIALDGDGAGSLLLMNNSRIFGNQVTGDVPYGGGLFCRGDYQLLLFGGSIHGNTAGVAGNANARGGGMYLDGCNLTWFAQNRTAPTDEAALRNNTAYGGSALGGGFGGGGLHARGGAQVDLIGAHLVFIGDPVSTRPLRIHDNLVQATSDSGFQIGAGSAVFAVGGGTRVRLDRTWVYGNESDSRGAFYALGGAEIIVERSARACHTPRRCSWVFDNQAEITAAAFAHGAGSAIRFRRTIVSGNSSAGTFITSLFENQFGGTIEVDDSLVFGNTADRGFAIFSDGSPIVRMRRSTMAANFFANEVFRINGDNTTVTIWDSIIHEPGTAMANNYQAFWTPTIDPDCVVWHDDQLGGANTSVADPRFTDPDNGAFYLRSDSPAINYCAYAPPPPGVDLDWNPRGLCHSTSEDCGLNVYDLGAYEQPMSIFSDRFQAP